MRRTLLILTPALLLCACPTPELELALPDTVSELPEAGTPPSQVAQCAPIEEVRCGDYVWGDSADPNSGHTTVIDGYPVAVGNFDGPEVAWEFVAPRTEQVTWRLVDPEPMDVNHDLFVLAGDGACRPDRALARGHNDLTFEARAGERYYLLLDGFDGDAGLFDAHLVCEGDDGAEPDPPPADPCEELRGAWDTDPLEVTARCSVVEDGAVADVVTGASPRWAVDGGSICLARGVFGLNGSPYYVVGGDLASASTDLPVHGLGFLGGDGSYAVEHDGGVSLLHVSLGYEGVDDGDRVTEVRWQADDGTLVLERRIEGFTADADELQISARLSCTEFGP